MLFKQLFTELLLLTHLHNVSRFLFKVVDTDVNISKFIVKRLYSG